MSVLAILSSIFSQTGKLYHSVGKYYGKIVLVIGGVKLAVEGINLLEFSRNYVYISNHASLFDIPAILAGIPDQIRLVYKKELEKIPLFGWGLKYGKTYIGINRVKGQDAIQSLKEAANKIRNGASVILFAEGTRSTDGRLQPFKRGSFMLAAQSGVPVVPVTIVGSFNILPKHSLHIKPGKIKLILSKPIAPSQANGRESEIALRDEVHAVIQKNLEEHQTNV